MSSFEFYFGAWDVGAMRFKERQLAQIPNFEIMIDMEHYKHDLQQIVPVSKSDKAEPEMLLPTTEMTRYGGGLGSIGCLGDHAVHNCPSTSCRRQNDATIQDMLKFK